MIGDGTNRTTGGEGHEPKRVMFLYWGRRGAMSHFTLELGRVVLNAPDLTAVISVSRQNEMFPAYLEFGDALLPVDTFTSNLGAIADVWRLVALRRRLAARLRADKVQAVIQLMPHVWTPLVASVIRKAGARLVQVIHDADGHLGDPTSMVHDWGLRGIEQTDVVLTLSKSVANRLAASGRVPARKIHPLFHPDLSFGSGTSLPLAPGEPVRLLFLGRILPYKGLPLFLDAVDRLKAQGIPVTFGVFGEGQLGSSAERLKKMGGEVVNRWLSEEEIGVLVYRFHLVVLSHIEASQSGVAATALGAGIPVVASPVGGLPEQVKHEETGLVAARPDAAALADSIVQIYRDPRLYQRLCATIAATRESRSMQRFVTEAVNCALPERR